MKTKKSLMKFLLVIMILSLLIFAVSCSSEPETPEDNPEEAVEPSEDDVDDGESNDDSEDESEEETEEPEEQEAEDDKDAESLLASTEEPDSYYYEQTITNESYGTTVQKYWFKGDNMKIEGEQEGQSYIVIWTEDFMANLDPETMTAFKTNFGEDTEDMEGMEGFGDNFDFDDDFGDEVEEDESITYIGEDTINGEPCYVFESVFQENKNKVWVHKDYGITMKAEVTGETADMNAVMEIKNLEIGGVSDSEFEIPEDYEVMEY